MNFVIAPPKLSFSALFLGIIFYIFIIFIAFLLLPNHAYANILFIDLNNAPSEIAVFNQHLAQRSVQASAGVRATKQTLWVIPSYARITPKQRAAAQQAHGRIETLTFELQNCAEKASRSPSGPAKALQPRVQIRESPCDSLYDHLRQAELSRNAATNAYNIDDFKSEIEQLATAVAQGSTAPIDTLVISGHHEAGFYQGELTQLRWSDLKTIFESNTVLFANVRTIVLLGCDTGTLQTYSEHFSPTFKQANLIIGAQDNAPTKNEPRNLAYIQQVLSLQPHMQKTKHLAQMQSFHRQLLRLNWPVSMLWRHKYALFKDSTLDFLQQTQSNPTASETLEASWIREKFEPLEEAPQTLPLAPLPTPFVNN